MFKHFMLRLIPVLSAMFIFSIQLNAQADLSTMELKENALKYFENEQYSEAVSYYKELLERYPKDGIFNYYAGVSMLKQKKQLDEAIEYLDYASSKSVVPSDVFYYLGLAYRENYQFPESAAAFRKFYSVADKKELKELYPGNEADMSNNAANMTLEYNPFDILASSLFTFRDSNYIHHIRGKGGFLTEKPEELMSNNEVTGELTNYFFQPRNISRGDRIFISGYDSRSKKNGADLFTVKLINGNKWGKPKKISALNSEFDEILPYFDPISNDLYFASTGHKSMGGYDVFKSHYDSERDTWNEPVNLGFPVNSPHNEYIVLPGPDLGSLFVLTDRQGFDTLLTAYILKMQEPKQSLAGASPEELKKIGKFGGIESIPQIVDIRKEEVISGNTENTRKKPEITSAHTRVKAVEKNPYQLNIKNALRYQVTADSLSRLAREARLRVRKLPDPDERWAWQRQIIEWEKYSKDFQNKADTLYKRTRELEEHKNLASEKTPESIEKDTVISGITVYKYKENENLDEKNTITQKAEEAFIAPSVNKKEETSSAKSITWQNVTASSENQFQILEGSPYDDNNPYPKNIILPKGPFYRIQLGVFSKKMDYNAFNGISPISAESIEGKGLTRYYAGKFTSNENARKALQLVKNHGIKDAFIVAWYDGQKMSVNRVQELEKRDNQ